MTILNDGVQVDPGGCVTLDDIKNYATCCGVVLDDDCCTDAVINANRLLAIELVEKITCTNWCPESVTKRFNGSGTCKLYFTGDYLNSLTSVTVDGCANCPYTFKTTPNNFNNWLEFICGDEKFPCGTQNIVVTGSWGRDMPEMVKTAVILLALEYSQPGVTGVQGTQGQIDTATWDDFSIKYNNKNTLSFHSTGYETIDRMLYPFIPTKSLVDIFTITSDNCVSNCCEKRKLDRCQ